MQRRVAELDALSRRADGSLRKGPLSKRCEATLAEPFDATEHPELIPAREALAHGWSELDALLDADFRVPSAPVSFGQKRESDDQNSVLEDGSVNSPPGK